MANYRREAGLHSDPKGKVKANQGTENGFWNLPTTDLGFDEPFGARYYFNLGAKYKVTERLTVHLDTFNVNASWDKKSSIRNNQRGTDLYRTMPAAYALSFYYDL